MFIYRRCSVVLKLKRLAVAVAVAKTRIFAAQIQGVDQPARRKDVEGKLGRRVDAGERSGGITVAFQAVETRQQPTAIFELARRDP